LAEVGISGLFSLVRFFWRSKRNERITKAWVPFRSGGTWMLVPAQAEKQEPATPANWLLTKNTHRVFFYVRPSAAFPPAGGFGYFLFVKKKKVIRICGEQKMNN
jgi:hypothetical protein